MTRPRGALAVAGAASVLGGAVLAPADPWPYLVAPTAGCLLLMVVLATWPRSRGHLVPLAVAVALVSLSVTATSALGPPPVTQPDLTTAVWILLEPAVLAVLVYLPVRWAPPRAAAWSAAAAGAASALAVHRYTVFGPLWEAGAASITWLTPCLLAAGVAWYLRSLEAAQHRGLEQARQQQRLDLAADLHDFVAHDVSEILAQAQAGRTVLTGQDPRVDQLLSRIETAGLRALGSMDRTVHVLREPGREPVQVLADLPALVERFRASTTGTVELDVAGRADLADLADLADQVPREPSAVLYRAAVEGLTNVRRHAGSPTRVQVAVRRTGPEVRLSVTDDGRGGRPVDRGGSGGHGLVAVQARVEALGGTLAAGPRDPHGWRMSVCLPLRGPDRGATSP